MRGEFFDSKDQKKGIFIYVILFLVAGKKNFLTIFLNQNQWPTNHLKKDTFISRILLCLKSCLRGLNHSILHILGEKNLRMDNLKKL